MDIYIADRITLLSIDIRNEFKRADTDAQLIDWIDEQLIDETDSYRIMTLHYMKLQCSPSYYHDNGK